MFDPNSPIGYPDGRGMQRPYVGSPVEVCQQSQVPFRKDRYNHDGNNLNETFIK